MIGNRDRLSLFGTVLLVAGVVGSAWAQTEGAPDTAKAMRRGLDWLQAHQKADGSWSDTNFPALTALGLWAFAGADHPDRTGVCARAAAFVAGFAQPDGGIYKIASGGRGSGGLSVYNTAICMTALHAYDRQRYADLILRARTFMSGAQVQGDSAGASAGGFGYERLPPASSTGGEKDKRSGAARADLSNTALSLMAMRVTQDLEDRRPGTEKRADVNWAAALAYASGLQNKDESDAENVGGFGYESSGDRGGVTTNRVAGARTLRGFGSMTYAGLESMLYAQVGREDPRVRSAIAWAVQHWSVTENPGQGSKGLFYYYTVMAKTLPLMGSGDLTSGNKAIAWRKDLISQLLKAQQADGSWANADNTFWENDPSLVTSYALLALQKCAQK